MKKDAFWFSHDSNAKDDVKSMKLIDQLGLEGYGIYWVLIETLRDQPEYKYPMELLPILARRYNTSGEKMKTVVSFYGLFEIDLDNNFFSLSLNERMIGLGKFREQRRLAGIKSAEKRRSDSTVVQRMLNGRSTDAQRVEDSIVEDSIVQKSRKDNSRNKREKKNKDFTPPSLSEVIIFFKEHEYSEASAVKAFNHYALANWHDTNGHQVINWKQKMNTVWFKPENLDKPSVELVPPPIPLAHAKK
jgi:hypothetical protein